MKPVSTLPKTDPPPNPDALFKTEVLPSFRMEVPRTDAPGAPGAAPPLGQQLVEAGKLKPQDVEKIVAAQDRGKLRFGETAILLGLLTSADVQEVLAKQYEYPICRPGASNLSRDLVTAENPGSVHSEAYRTLRSQLTLRWLNDRRKCLAITSARQGEGASALAANLAIVFAQQGERTLLIDANFRQPMQHRLFGLDGATPGLSSLLKGRCTAKDALLPVRHFQSLYVVGAGAAPPNPQELLTRTGFSFLVQTAPADFDVIIIDTPPILEFADAQLVASRTGACVLSLRRDSSRVADVKKVRHRLEPTGAQLLGAVLAD